MVFQAQANGELPECSNPKCDKKGTILVGTLFFCGPCCRMAMKFKQEHDNVYLMERFSDGKE